MVFPREKVSAFPSFLCGPPVWHLRAADAISRLCWGSLSATLVTLCSRFVASLWHLSVALGGPVWPSLLCQMEVAFPVALLGYHNDNLAPVPSFVFFLLVLVTFDEVTDGGSRG